jgi:hypothetical protein
MRCRTTRRALLRGAAAAGVGFAGCGGRADVATTTRTTAPAAGSAGKSLPEARGVRVRNASDSERIVTVAVTRDGETAFGETVRLDAGPEPLPPTEPGSAGWQRAFPRAVARAGTYRVVVETADGERGVHDWRVADALGDLVVTVGDGISASDRGERADGSSGERSESDGVAFVQEAFCDPDCPPVSAGGIGDLPYYGGEDAHRHYYGGSVVVENAGGPRRLGLVVAGDGATVLDYEYDLPAATRLRLPGVHVPGVYRVAATVDGETATHDWHVRAERWLFVRVGDRVRFDCGETSQDLELENEGEEPRRLTVTATRDGETVLRETYEVAGGERRTEPDVLRGSGRYRLRAETGDGRSASRDWWLCPPRGPTRVTVGPGTLLVSQYLPPR